MHEHVCCVMQPLTDRVTTFFSLLWFFFLLFRIFSNQTYISILYCSFSFILVDDGFFSEAPSQEPSSQLNAIAQTQGIPFIGEHPDDIDIGDRVVEIGDINVRHIGSGKPPVPGPTVSMAPSEIPSTEPSESVEPSSKPSPAPTSKIDDEGNRFIGIKFGGRN